MTATRPRAGLTGKPRQALVRAPGDHGERTRDGGEQRTPPAGAAARKPRSNTCGECGESGQRPYEHRHLAGPSGVVKAHDLHLVELLAPDARMQPDDAQVLVARFMRMAEVVVDVQHVPEQLGHLLSPLEAKRGGDGGVED